MVLFIIVLNSGRTILLVEVEGGFRGDVGRTCGPHLVLRSIPCLLHVGLDQHLRLACISGLLVGVGAVAADDNVVVSFDLVIDASLELVGLVHAVCKRLLLQVVVYLPTGSVGS